MNQQDACSKHSLPATWHKRSSANRARQLLASRWFLHGTVFFWKSIGFQRTAWSYIQKIGLFVLHFRWLRYHNHGAIDGSTSDGHVTIITPLLGASAVMDSSELLFCDSQSRALLKLNRVTQNLERGSQTGKVWNLNEEQSAFLLQASKALGLWNVTEFDSNPWECWGACLGLTYGAEGGWRKLHNEWSSTFDS